MSTSFYANLVEDARCGCRVQNVIVLRSSALACIGRAQSLGTIHRLAWNRRVDGFKKLYTYIFRVRLGGLAISFGVACG